jgi:hypothetical protein
MTADAPLISPDTPLLSTLNIISQQYPQFIPLIQQSPDILRILIDAINNPDSWSPERIQAAVESTPWWNSTDAGTRKLQLLTALDPATANLQVSEASRMAKLAQENLGVQINTPDFLRIVAEAAAQGWDQNRIMAEIGQAANPAGPATGMVANKMTELQGIAADYGVQMSQQSYWKYATNIASGWQPQDLFESDVRMQALALYPALEKQIEQGMTVKQYAQPFFQVASQELGINPNQIQLTDPKWSNLIVATTPTGVQYARDQTDMIKQVRNDPRYGWDSSTTGVTAAAGLATQLKQLMGAQG